MSSDNLSTADVHMTVAARAENVAVVRQVVSALTESIGLPHPVREDVRIAVTEACSNVVRHAYAGTQGPMSVSVSDAGGELLVEVVDHGCGMHAHRRPGGAGLGLPIITALADDVEIGDAPESGSRVAMSFAHDPLEAATP
jgi:serine/threonine-protein kinase RsbW